MYENVLYCVHIIFIHYPRVQHSHFISHNIVLNDSEHGKYVSVGTHTLKRERMLGEAQYDVINDQPQLWKLEQRVWY